MRLRYVYIVLGIIVYSTLQAQNTSVSKKRFYYDTGVNNWLNFYPTVSKNPAPVYIWAHPNSDGKKPPSADGIPLSLVQNLIENEIAVISWESVPQLKTPIELKTCQEDLEKVVQWVHNNALNYNFDINQLYLGGASRGSVIVWQFINEYPEKIKGAYLVQALPKSVWDNEDADPRSFITNKSPHLILSYRDSMNTKDGHSPLYGQKIVERYIELGIGNKIKLYHSQGKSLYKHLIKFIK